MNALTRYRLWCAVALVTALAVALTSGMTLVGRLLTRSASTSADYFLDVRQLDVDLPGGSVVIRPGPVGRVTVSQTLSWTTSRPRVEVLPDSRTRTLQVRSRCDDYAPLSSWGCQVGLTIQVPPRTSVRSIAGSGATLVAGLDGALDLSAASGPITLQGVTGSVVAGTSSGPISGDRLLSRSFSASSGSGSMDLSFSVAPQDVRLNTSSGSVSLLVPRGSRYAVNATSQHGQVDLPAGLADPGAAGGISVTTVSGSADVAYNDILAANQQPTVRVPPSG